MERIYYHFPSKVDFERDYGYGSDLKYLVRVMASIHGKSGSIDFETIGPDIKRHVDTVRAKREVSVDIAERRVDFVALNAENMKQLLPTIPATGSADFRVTVMYSYLDEHYNKMSLKSDVFLVRSTVEGGLNLQVVNIEGQNRTLPEEIANTIETQLKHYKG